MNYDLLWQLRLSRFKEILKFLPGLSEVPAELLVMSAGNRPGNWSFRHVEMPGETLYFIFRKAGYMEGKLQSWECVDRELNELMHGN